MELLERVDLNVLNELHLPAMRQRVSGIISTDSLPKFQHLNAATVEEAVFWLNIYGGKAAVIAGGTDLLRELKNRARPTQPEMVLNIKSIKPQLDFIEERASCLVLGSVSRLYSLETSDVIKKKYPLLAQAAHATKSVQYRTMATLGGDLCQHVKCWYNRAGGNAYYCTRKGGSTCYARDGDNRYHSIFGGGHCVALCPSDCAPALMALGASVKLAGVSGTRLAPIEEFYTTLGTALKEDEIVTEVHIPLVKPACQSVFVKFGLGNLYGRALVGVAIVARLREAMCEEISIVLGAVSPMPWRAVHAERVLAGEKITQRSVERAAQAATKDAAPLRKNAYKVDMVRAAVKRAILKVVRKVDEFKE